jgi:hypothetical protein
LKARPTGIRHRRLETKNSADSELDELNEKYAVVPIGGNVRVMDLTKETPTYYRVTDFRLLLGNRTRVEGKNHIPLATWWLSEPRRRQYEGVCFEPGKWQEVDRKRNLWTGFAVMPKPGNCARYLDFLREVICSGSQGHYDYLVNVMADAVQRPNKQGDVAVVLRGLEGVGKGFAVNTFGYLFGRHFVSVTQASHLTGKFNGHLAQCSLLFADEAFFAGDRQHDAVLKALITEPTLLIERKGVDATPAQNKTHLWIASNESWVVPAGPSARRYFCLDVADAYRNDSRYFEAIAAQMRNGGYEALLHTLLNRDLSKVNIRQVPQTEALAEQKAWSRRGIDALVEWVAHEGVLPCAALDPSIAITSGAEPSFYDVARRRVPDLAHKTPTAITRALTKEWRCTSWHVGYQRGIRFPPLQELRQLVDAKFGQIDWPATQHWGETE